MNKLITYFVELKPIVKISIVVSLASLIFAFMFFAYKAGVFVMIVEAVCGKA